MTVSNQQTEFSYTGNGVTVTFAYSCQVQKAGDLQVYVNGAAVTSGITKNGIGSLSGGSVTFSVAPASGAAVRLERVVVLERTTDYQQNGDFLARVVNPDFDRLWMALQQFASGLSRSLRFPKSDINPVTELPPAAVRANKLLGFDSSGNLLLAAPVSGSVADFAITLASSAGSSFMGWILNAIGAAPRTVENKLREMVSITDFYANGVSGPRVDPTGVIDSTAGIQQALNLRGCIYIPPGKYRISSTLTIYGGTMFYGAGMGVSIFDWHGPTTGNIMQDSSLINPLDVNLNIVLADFEIAGNSYSNNPLYAIRMYRVGRAKYIGLLLHDVGGSLLLWGVSQADTVDIEISGCIFERAFNGDSCQGIGERVVVRDCYAFSAGDTCYALLYDTSPITNPTYLFTSNVVFDNCVAVGEYDKFGAFQGAGRPTQLGFSFGPFNVAVNINVSITNCLCEGLYQNVWMVVFGKLKLNDNTFKQHANTTTAGVRLDGIMNATVDGNSFEAGLVGTGGNYGSLLINAQRNSYGSSIFDASNKFTVISSNTFEHDTAPAIVLASDPTYPIQISDIVISDNTFAGVTLPVQFRPLISTGLAFKNINISGNTVDSAATAFLTCFGSPPQYSNVSMADNSIGSVPPLAGSSDNILVSGSNSLVTLGVLAATATTVFTLPSTGFNTIQVQSWVQIENSTYSSIATFILTAGVPRLVWKSDGTNFSITLSGSNVQVTQAGIGTQNVYTTVKYMS